MTIRNYQNHLSALETTPILASLCQLQRGIERECLRVDQNGHIAQTPHPIALGSPLTHPSITTDFSEALMELITPVTTQIDELLRTLNHIHVYIYQHLGDEILWAASMPCILPNDELIPLANYGHSNIAQQKTIYRRGLGHRYGRLMQTIAGIHYNFSLPDQFWQHYQSICGDQGNLQDFITRSYFHLIRNFRRYSWLLLYLFGASPVVCKSFLQGREHRLLSFDQGSLFGPDATALRMGQLGYQSHVQSQLNISYNCLGQYLHGLTDAIQTPHWQYEKIGIKRDGEYQQLSGNILQIENEFYSTIRPKRATPSGEKPANVLKAKGVEYIEIRLLDINPYLPLGIDKSQIQFLDTFLLYCLFKDSPFENETDLKDIKENQSLMVEQGRSRNLELWQHGERRHFTQWATEIFAELSPIAKLLDQAQNQTNQHQTDQHQTVVRQNQSLLDHPHATPSGRILAQMGNTEVPFFRFAMNQSLAHRSYFRNQELNQEQIKYYDFLVSQSLEKQKEIEQADSLDFDTFLQQYFDQ